MTKKTGPHKGARLQSVPAWGPATSSRGEHAVHQRLWEEINPVQQRALTMLGESQADNADGRMSAMPNRNCQYGMGFFAL